MFNKDLRAVDTTMFLNKLTMLLERLNLQYRDGTFQTQEDVIDEFQRALRMFYDSATIPLLALRPARKGYAPDYQDYNDSFEELGWDLDVIFKEISTLESIVLRNFNHTVSERDKLNKLVKRISSKVGDYVLYSKDPIGDTIYFKDSFGDVSRIDFGSGLLSQKQCDINVAEGIVTLPAILTDTPTSKTAKVQINTNSGPGGSNGNYQELGASPHDDIRDILDDNPDTWFEYERVQRSTTENTEPLTLDLTFYFDEPQIINSIRVNPNNFGTLTTVKIDQIDTSFNGNTWVSIKDDIPIAGYLEEDEENIFTLAPSTSKYAGQGIYTFTPRKAKYVHLVLTQDTPYLINTSSGQRYRYAIGIRDIVIKAVPYEPNGDIISNSFDSPVEIKKIALLANENPAEASDLADIKHQISVDDGATWYDIQPQDRSGTEIPEILNVNTGDAGAIISASPVYSIRHRMLLSRNKEKFQEGASTLSTIIEGASDILAMPVNSPMTLALSRSPVAGTVRLMNPLWGARAYNGTEITDTVDGKVEIRRPVIRAIGRSTGQPNQEFKEVLSQEIGDGSVDIWSTNNEVVVWVDNDSTWSRVGDFTADSNNKEYKLTNNGSVIFGNRDTGASLGAGRIPDKGALIGFTLKEERLVLGASAPYNCDLALSTDGDKENVKIYRRDEKEQVVAGNHTEAFRIKPGVKVIRLPHRNIASSPVVTFAGTGASTIFADLKTFQNGSDEFVDAGDYSIDYTNGIIYTYTVVPATANNWTVSYWYTPWVELTSSDWDFVVDADRKYNRIVINDSGYRDIEHTFALPNSVRMVQLLDVAAASVKSVVPGSIEFSTPTAAFTSGLTPQEVPYQDGETEFKVQDTAIDTDGWFSVDYKSGIMYIAPTDTTAAASAGNITYRYTDFIMCYNISKQLSSSAYTVDNTAKTISLNEREALKIWGDRDADAGNKRLIKAIYDYVQSTRESIEELEPYFTPIARDYVLKILPGD